jgi:hypothetical protein
MGYGIIMDIRVIDRGCGVDSTGSGQGPVAGCCERGNEPSSSGSTELVTLADRHTGPMVFLKCLHGPRVFTEFSVCLPGTLWFHELVTTVPREFCQWLRSSEAF